MDFLWALLLSAVAGAGDDPVRIGGGLITGSVAGEVRVYKGIPFAAPPMGDLRWKPPQPVQPWEGVRACAEYGPWCPQPKPMIGRELGTMKEDCLYLNVWTAAKGPGEKRPVMVWIHGGGFTTGSGAMASYDGEKLACEGAVVVTINYRLGPLGFFGHPLLSKESAKGLSGNYGFLDQVAALEWVKRNIAAFGGDPGCVTIFGESAGSASVCRLMVSPLAEGLFHRAIAQSGGAHGRNRHLRERREEMDPLENLGEAIARELGCEKEKDPLGALRAKSADEILAASNPAQGLFGKGNKFGPVVDGWALPEDPGLLWEQGKHRKVPFLLGTNADEGTIFLQQLQIRNVAGYQMTVRYLFRDEADTLLKLFPASSDGEVAGALNKLVTVGSFVSPARVLARASARDGVPTWLYHFTRVPDSPLMRRLGAFHGLEIPYVFGNFTGAGLRLVLREKDRELSKSMRTYWLNFAHTGDPNGGSLPVWPACDEKKDGHLDLGDEVRAGSGLYREACDAIDAARARRQGAGEPRETPK
jgi:para-nitrobenzyl esterase